MILYLLTLNLVSALYICNHTLICNQNNCETINSVKVNTTELLKVDTVAKLIPRPTNCISNLNVLVEQTGVSLTTQLDKCFTEKVKECGVALRIFNFDPLYFSYDNFVVMPGGRTTVFAPITKATTFFKNLTPRNMVFFNCTGPIGNLEIISHNQTIKNIKGICRESNFFRDLRKELTKKPMKNSLVNKQAIYLIVLVIVGVIACLVVLKKMGKCIL